jgi:polyisoprenyl-teichoic acid--peptidoglycan teichoic acid transferase
MKNQRSSVDGFIPRRSGSRLGDLHNVNNRPLSSSDLVKKRELHSTSEEMNRVLGQSSENSVHIRRPDIDESLNSIESLGEPKRKLSRRERKRLAKINKKPKSRARRITKRFFIFLLIVILCFGGFIAFRFIIAGGNITNGNFFDLLQMKKLKQDSSGRSNFLVVGTSEDDANHGGADLTDSILVLSVDQKNKDMFMFSVPRDLYVDYGQACNSGYSGKINEYFICSNAGTTKSDEQDRLEKTQDFIGEIFGLDIQYGVHVNHTVIKEAVDAVGGIDIDIQGSNGSSGILDRNFDWRCNYKCYYVKYENGVHHLDGLHALFLAQARGDVAPTYGLGNSNFDREKNQQKIILALKKKAMSAGTLTNIGAVTQLIDALGNNLRTNVDTSEIRTLMQLANDIKSSDIHSLSLVDEGLVDTGNYGGASIVKPSAGVYVYDDIQEFIKKSISSDPVVREAAPVTVLNGTGRAGYAQLMADDLADRGYTIASVNTAPDGSYADVEIYQIGSGNTATAKQLKKLYGVKEIKKTDPPALVTGETKFVVIFGAVKADD